MTAKHKPPPIPRRFTRRRKVEFWGQTYTVKPAVASAHLGDGRKLLWFEPLNTRPDYYLIRVDSSWPGKWEDGEPKDGHDEIDGVIDALEDEFSERERERAHLEEDLREQGIKPDGDNTDLAGNEERLGFPVLALDCGYSWGVMAVHDGRCWRTSR